MGSTSQYRHISFFTALLLALAGLTGCASTSSVTHQSAEAAAPTTTKSQLSPHYALAIAVDMIGTPYRYGGTSPRGFDCSGLVYYAYRKAGIHSPRTTTEQYRQSKRVPVSHLQPGDLVFFTIIQGRLSHVGIYVGDDRFIHAPSSGKSVAYATLHDPYWQERLIGAGRIQ
jgi:cell wall-associated NlpC family hydrolase